jgi:hypothetical protein
LVKAKEFADKCRMKIKTLRRSKEKLAKHETTDEPIQDAEENFRINCFIKVVDPAIIAYK